MIEVDARRSTTPSFLAMLLRTRPIDGAIPPRSLWRDRLAVALYGAAISLPGLLALGIKRKILSDPGGGFDQVAWASGLADGTHLSALQKLALFRWDIVMMFIIGPLAWLTLIRFTGPRLRAALTMIVAVVISAALFIELKTFWEVGTFLPLYVLLAGAVGAGRKFASEYLQVGSLIKLGLLTVSILAASYVAFRIEEAPRRRLRGAPGWKASLGLVAASIATALIPLVPPTAFSRSAGILALTEFAGLGSGRIAHYTNRDLTADALLQRYRELSHAPVPNDPSPYFGKARGYNVLVYLYESLPYACLHDAATADSYRNLRSLEHTSFIANRHYATYPYSRRAYFSIYSGWYPPHGMRDFTDETWDDVSTLMSPGMVRGARSAGYTTAAYVPERPQRFEADSVRFRVLGFERHVVTASGEQRVRIG